MKSPRPLEACGLLSIACNSLAKRENGARDISARDVLDKKILVNKEKLLEKKINILPQKVNRVRKPDERAIKDYYRNKGCTS